MKAIKNPIKRTARKAAQAFTDACAPIQVRATDGFKMNVWTFDDAMEWTHLCADDSIVVVVHRATGELLATKDALI